MRVLITTSKHCGSYQLVALLKHHEVLFGDDFADFPSLNSNSLAHQILKFCLDHQIQKVFPLQFAEIEELRKSTVLFDEFGIEIMLGIDDLATLNQADRKATSFAELSSNLIALGYPNQKIAIANANDRGELIVIDDTVNDNLQIWNKINSINFNQLGKWFNQTNFSPVYLYRLTDSLAQFFVLIEGDEFKTFSKLNEDVAENLKNILQNKNLKGFYHIAIVNHKVLRIVNTAL